MNFKLFWFRLWVWLLNLKGDSQIVILVAIGQCSILKNKTKPKHNQTKKPTPQKKPQKENIGGSPGYVT